MRGLLRFLQRESEPIDPATWRLVRQRVPWTLRLDAERDLRLRTLASLFLQRKAITTIGDLQLTATDHAVLASLCCLSLLEFGIEGLHGWSQLLVYPDAFRAHRSHVDAAGVMHEWDDELIGEAWEQGPLVLSWADVCADLQEPDAGYCVAVHEMAHKLDALDGLLDGTPLLPRPWQREWASDFQAAFDAFARRVGAGGDVPIDPYAAESPEEFFAVCSEYHFSDPRLLDAEMPHVADHLRRFYGPSPFA